MYRFGFLGVFPFRFFLRLPSFTHDSEKRLLYTREFWLPAFDLPSHNRGGKREEVSDRLTDEKVYIVQLLKVM